MQRRAGPNLSTHEASPLVGQRDKDTKFLTAMSLVGTQRRGRVQGDSRDIAVRGGGLGGSANDGGLGAPAGRKSWGGHQEKYNTGGSRIACSLAYP